MDGEGDGSEGGPASEPPLAQVAAALLQRTVLRGPPPHDCGLLCLKAQPLDCESGQERQQQNGGGGGGAAGGRRRRPARCAVEVAVAHCAQSMAFGHMACGGNGGGGAEARAAAPAVFVLRRQAGCSGRPAPAVQTYTHGTAVLL